MSLRAVSCIITLNMYGKSTVCFQKSEVLPSTAVNLAEKGKGKIGKKSPKGHFPMYTH